MAEEKRVSVKSVKTFAGHDGHGWQCKVVLDGKTIQGTCVDDGWGGGLYFNGADPSTNDALDTIEEIACENPEYAKFKMRGKWELLIHDLVAAALKEKDIQKRTTKEVWFQLEGDGANQYRTFKRQYKVSSPQCHMDEHRIIDAIAKHAQREGQAIKSIKGIRKATKRKELVACQ